MSNELAPVTPPKSALEVIGDKIAATGGASWIAVTHYAALASLARSMVQANIAPKGVSPDQALGIMAFGLELGLGPIASLSSIAFVNGRPSMFGDGIMALLMRSGELADMPAETIEGTGDARVAVCTLKRKSMATPITRRFSISDAKAAGLWGKSGPWTQYPERMLRWRAFGWAARDGFADVLRGLWTREEAMDIPTVEVRTVEAQPAPAAPAASTTPAPAPAQRNEITTEHTRLGQAVLYLAEGDQELAGRLLFGYSKFKGKDGSERGAKSVAEMSLAWVRATWAKVEPEYERACAQDAPADDEVAA